MNRSVSDSMMSRLSAFLKQQMGLLYPPERWNELERSLSRAAREFGFSDTAACIRWLMSAPLERRQIETLASFLTVGETYFYRDPRILEVLEQRILPEIVRHRRGSDRRLRLWSAACSSGEEAYSLAILLHRLLPDLPQWNVTILATDINKAALQKGLAGVYGKWSFRNTPSWLKTLYFSAEEGDRFRIKESVRRMVSFEYLNLADDSYPSLPTNTNAMDLIFCRNVLIYFDQETVHRVVGKLNRCLVEGGWLIVGPAETVPRGYPGYRTVSLNGATCYQKAEQGLPSAVPTERPELQPLPGVEPAPAGISPVGLWQEKQDKGASGQPIQSESVHPVQPVPPAGSRGGDEAYPAAAEAYRQGRYREAADLLRELTRRGELGREGVALLIRSQANQGLLSEARQLCEEALAKDKLDPALHYLRAEILQEGGLDSEAQLALQRALYLDPKLVLAHFALGNLTLWSGKADRARRHFENALALLESSPPGEILPGSEGMTAGRLKEVILSIMDGARRAGGGRR